MSVEVFAADEQSVEPVDILQWLRLAKAVLVDEGVRGETELSILFVDEAAIADLNQRFLGKDGPTDVLAFPIDEEPAESGRSPDSGGSGPGDTGEPPEAPTLLGDVVICPTVARRNALERTRAYEDELALLVVHGVLHLLGMDHEDDAEAEAMEAKERELLARHHQAADEGPRTRPADEGPSTAPAHEGPRTRAADEGPSTAPAHEGPRTRPADERPGTEGGGRDEGVTEGGV